MPWVHEILETRGRIINTKYGRMHVPKPIKVRIRWVNTEWEQMDILDMNCKMVRPWFACVQPEMFDSILDFEADPNLPL